jgi:NAD(P)-dependent dehydrogenase (short-subunit alcohol dehydrogenase family)
LASNYFDMSGKVVMVTGGTRGLGLAMARGFAEMGADLVISSRKQDACDETCAEIRAMGRRALAHACHIGYWDEIPALVEAAYAEFGKVDVLVNNAGIAPVAPSSSAVSQEMFDKIVGVNFKGPFRLSALIGDRMVKAGRGSIINISSAGSVRPHKDLAIYGGAKAAINIMSQCQAFEFGPTVRVNVIMAGAFWTDISKAWREEVDKNNPYAARRIGRPHEIVTAALYLASDHSSYTTGTVLSVDGGIP